MSTELAPEEQKHKSDKSASWRSQYPAGCILTTVVTWAEKLSVIYGLPRDRSCHVQMYCSKTRAVICCAAFWLYLSRSNPALHRVSLIKFEDLIAAAAYAAPAVRQTIKTKTFTQNPKRPFRCPGVMSLR